MKLALHRSITFWSGLLVMAFICWAWRDSYILNRYVDHRGYGFSHMGGGIALAKVTHYLGRQHGTIAVGNSLRMQMFPPPLFILSANPPPDPKPPAIHPPFTIKESWMSAAKRETGSIRIFIPHWLILLTFALLWLALLIWRARRRTTAI